jgi:cyclopropane fatty-acyl-phospholipid synthase-like methyltransferase
MQKTHKPYAESCDQNREPIRQVLDLYTENRATVLEIGSGTGQHAVYFSAVYPWLHWQTSDLAQYHPGIQAWIDDSGVSNVAAPLMLDCRQTWPPLGQFDLVFSANTLHIMSPQAVSGLFANLSGVMSEEALFLVYGPFNYAGDYTSDSNRRFDDWLKQRDPASGIRDFDWLTGIAAQNGLECRADHSMPANNRILVWGRAGMLTK